MSALTLTPAGVNLDECRVCHKRVLDFEDGGYEGENAQRGHYACDAKLSYRVVDLVARKTVITGLSLNEAHSFIQREKRRRPQARFDIRTEVRQ